MICSIAGSGPLPVPLTEAPATSLNYHRPDVAWSRLDGVARPTPGRRGITNARQGYPETLATGLHAGLFSCPTTEEALGLEVARQPVQILNFSH